MIYNFKTNKCLTYDKYYDKILIVRRLKMENLTKRQEDTNNLTELKTDVL